MQFFKIAICDILPLSPINTGSFVGARAARPQVFEVTVCDHKNVKQNCVCGADGFIVANSP